jgi:hypothetical protein
LYVHAGVNQPKSLKCNKIDQFKIQDFSKVQMKTSFQSQLSNLKKDRNFLPSVCMTNSLNNVKIILNDHKRVAQSSLRSQSYNYSLYKIDFDISNIAPNQKQGSLVNIMNTTVVDENVGINASKILTLKGLNYGKYLLKTLIEETSLICSTKSGGCMTESTLNNEFECIKCSKLLTIFNLQRDKNRQISKNCPGDQKLFESSVTDIDYQDFEEFKCSVNAIYGQESEKIPDIYSYVVDADFEVDEKNFKIPFDKLDENLACNEGFALAMMSRETKSSFYFNLIVMSFVFLGFCVFAVNFIVDTCLKHNKRTTISNAVFFLSIHISDDDLEQLDELITCFTEKLKENFLPKVNFDIVKRTSSNSLNKEYSELLDKADLITYICCSMQEIEQLDTTKSNIKNFGLTKEQNLLNRLRLCETLKPKSINITFSRISPKKKSSKSNADADADANAGDSSESVLLETTQIKENNYYVLPKQTSQYLEHIFLSEDKLKLKRKGCINSFKRFVDFVLRKMLAYRIKSMLVKLIAKQFKNSSHRKKKIIQENNRDMGEEELKKKNLFRRKNAPASFTSSVSTNSTNSNDSSNFL